MYEQSGNAVRLRSWLKPFAWIARTAGELGLAPSRQASASGQFVEQLPASQVFRLVEELLASLSQPLSHSEFYRRLLAEVEAITGSQGSILYCESDHLNRVLVANLEQPEHSLEELIEQACPLEELATRPHRHPQGLWVRIDGNPDTQTNTNGVEHCRLLLRLPGNCQIGHHEISQLRCIGASLNCIMQNLRRANLDQQFMHNRERALIARELHDSLAQSLSFLKIQLTRLQNALQGEQQSQELQARLRGPLEDLRKGVDLSYRQLRELINTFRLTMDGRGLVQALDGSLKEFGNMCDMVFSLDNRLTGTKLSAEEETHLLLVAREALSNAVRHSHGTRAEASLWTAASGAMHLVIDDDGIGLKDTIPDGSHGLLIMRQRMQDLGGELATAESPLGGTRIHASFYPRSSKPGNNEVQP